MVSQVGGATAIKWPDGTMWVRRAPDEAALCCARCRNTTGCRVRTTPCRPRSWANFGLL
jgi:hypothetical protein